MTFKPVKNRKYKILLYSGILILGSILLIVAGLIRFNFFDSLKVQRPDIFPGISNDISQVALLKSMIEAKNDNISKNKKISLNIISIQPGDFFSERLQNALITAPSGSVIEMPAGNFKFENEISIAKPFITLRGQGKGKTILDFAGQSAGKQGIFATHDGVTLEDFTVLNTDGNGVKVTGSNGVIIRRIEMKWTRGANTENGGYAIYPVNTQNLLIEECEVSGASDSGIYVGQSKNVIVRNNLAYGNVAGIEIENTQNADVYNNLSTDNTAGILIFDLPNLNLRQGGHIRIFDNVILNNNLRNFAPAGNIVSSVAKGIGILVVATKNIEIFNNKLTKNNFTDIIFVNYLITGIKINDEKIFDPTPDSLFIHDNQTSDEKSFGIDFSNEINIVANWLFKTKMPNIIYDGIRDGFYNREKFQNEKRICILRNQSASGIPASFGNMHLDSGQKILMFPGGPATRDIENHNCEHRQLIEVKLDPPVYDAKKYPDLILNSNTACDQNSKNQVNFKAALMADCNKLSDYNLFFDPKNPIENPNKQGSMYSLSSTLFTDYALKARFIFLPAGTKAEHRDTGVLNFPVGAIISKTFWYENKKANTKNIIETRLLIHRPTGWVALPYVWNDDQTEALLTRGGSDREISSDWVSEENINTKSFSYRTPNSNQCLNCHNINNQVTPIGPKAKWLDPNGDNYNDLNLPLERRARAYLDINCSHCHNPTGSAGMSGLWLELERDIASPHAGVCKHPVAAGTAAAKLKYDIVPGHPEESLLIRRMRSVRPANRMPELGRSLVHEKGVQLVENWIQQMSGQSFPQCDQK